jgi:hypothetical protein
MNITGARASVIRDKSAHKIAYRVSDYARSTATAVIDQKADWLQNTDPCRKYPQPLSEKRGSKNGGSVDHTKARLRLSKVSGFRFRRKSVALCGLVAILLMVFGMSNAALAETRVYYTYLGDGTECNENVVGIEHYYDGAHWLCTRTEYVDTKYTGDTIIRYTWVQDDGTYRQVFRVDNNNLCISVAGDSSNNGAAVVQTACNIADHSQWWAQLGNYYGYGLLRNYHSGKCIYVSGGTQTLGSPLIQEPCSDNHSMYWAKNSVGSGVWNFANYHSAMYITVPGGLMNDQLQLCQYGAIGVYYQLWGLRSPAT